MIRFRNQFLRRLAELNAHDMFDDLSEVNMPAGRTLFDVEEIVETVYFPSTAVLSAVTIMQDGRMVETRTIGAESVAGIVPALTEMPALERVFVQVPGAGLQLPAKAFRAAVAKDARLLFEVLRYAQLDAAQSQQAVACNALHSLEERLCRWLLITSDQVGGPVFDLTQDYLSIMLGVQRTSVSLVASALKSEGLIDYTRGKITLLDRRGVERRACECYSEVSRAQAALSDLSDAGPS
jgi:CRP-like cAMP-binding protein